MARPGRSARSARPAPPKQRTGRGTAALVATVITGGLVLSACSETSGLTYAQQACAHVHRSIVAFAQSATPDMPAATAASLRQKADNELRAALPLAARANSADGSWNSLMTTISESATIDEGHLVPALRATCAVANSNQNVNPQSPGTSNTPNTHNTPNTANVNPKSPG
jgi:hypothetical protein